MLKTFFDSLSPLANVGRSRPSHPVENFFTIFFIFVDNVPYLPNALFEEKKVRIVWDEEQEKYWFSVVDIVQVLTDSTNPTDYLKKLRKRDSELGAFLGTNCPQVEMLTFTGKKRKTLSADLQGIFRIIQSIPSKKAEPVKQWLVLYNQENIILPQVVGKIENSEPNQIVPQVGEKLQNEKLPQVVAEMQTLLSAVPWGQPCCAT